MPTVFLFVYCTLYQQLRQTTTRTSASNAALYRTNLHIFRPHSSMPHGRLVIVGLLTPIILLCTYIIVWGSISVPLIIPALSILKLIHSYQDRILWLYHNAHVVEDLLSTIERSGIYVGAGFGILHQFPALIKDFTAHATFKGYIRLYNLGLWLRNTSLARFSATAETLGDCIEACIQLPLEICQWTCKMVFNTSGRILEAVQQGFHMFWEILVSNLPYLLFGLFYLQLAQRVSTRIYMLIVDRYQHHKSATVEGRDAEFSPRALGGTLLQWALYVIAGFNIICWILPILRHFDTMDDIGDLCEDIWDSPIPSTLLRTVGLQCSAGLVIALIGRVRSREERE